MKQHTEKQLVAAMSVPERAMHTTKVDLIQELEAEILKDKLGLQQSEERMIVLDKVAPTQDERDFDRGTLVADYNKRYAKALGYIDTYKAMLQSHTEQLSAAREAVKQYQTRVNVRLGLELQEQTERKLMAKALVEAMLEAGLVKV